MEAWHRTNYGRRRLAHYLATQGMEISPHTIRHILDRHRPPSKRVRRQCVYPARWAWEVEEPFALIQTDTKDILDKGALGTRITTHLLRQGLPRYQWTACDGRTRLRFLAYSQRLNRTNGMAFLVLVLMWLRAFSCRNGDIVKCCGSPTDRRRVWKDSVKTSPPVSVLIGTSLPHRR